MAAAPAGIRWERSLDAAMRSARRTRRPVMILFLDPSPVSAKFEQATFGDAKVVRASRAWHCVRVERDQQPELAKARGVAAFPTVVFTDRAGKEIGRLVGSRPPSEWLEDVKALPKPVGGR